MRVVVVGLGAIGSLMAYALAAGGAEVTALASSRVRQSAVQQEGLMLVDGGRTLRLRLSRAVRNPDVLLVCVKTYQTADAVRHAAQAVCPQAVCLMQNGMGRESDVQAAFPAVPLLFGVTTEAAYRVGGHVSIRAGRGKTYFGDGHLAAALVGTLRRGGLTAEACADMRARRWRKLAVNALINPLTALLQVRNGALAQSAPLRPLLEALADEIADAAAHDGVHLSAAVILAEALDVAARTRSNVSSMLQDRLRGGPTEIEAILGFVASRLGPRARISLALIDLIRENLPPSHDTNLPDVLV